jgi:hypothetical protein
MKKNVLEFMTVSIFILFAGIIAAKKYRENKFLSWKTSKMRVLAEVHKSFNTMQKNIE